MIPANSSTFFKELDDMITFDPLPDDYIPIINFIGDIFYLSHDYEIEVSLGASFEALGYESPYLLENMGSMTLFLMLYIALIPFFFLFLFICRCKAKLRNWFKKKIDGIFFNGILAFLDGTYLLIAIMATINMK